jgi:hypothetical protein
MKGLAVVLVVICMPALLPAIRNGLSMLLSFLANRR